MIKDLVLVFQKRMPFDFHEQFENALKMDYNVVKSAKIPTEWNAHHSEYILNLLCDKIKSLNGSKKLRGILIDLGVGEKSRESVIAVDLAIHIRLSHIDLPVIIMSELHPIINNRITIPPLSYSLIYDLGIAQFLTYGQIFDKTKSIDGSYPVYEKLNDKFDLSIFLQQYEAKSPNGRHQVTNEWGAVKLALNAGYATGDIKYEFPRTQYFKYLLSKYPLNQLDSVERNVILKKHKLMIDPDKIDLSPFLKKNRVLLIDDNYDKGWKSVLETIFKCSVIGIKSDKEALAISDHVSYDIVFLDLYLPNPAKYNVSDMENSKKILQYLKQKYPEIPIIIFTASNKSWTLNEILELGADGMYVKESPEYAGDKEYSMGNLDSFISTTCLTLIKYQTLRPYWESIKLIISHPAFHSIQEKSNSKFQERIDERFKMFYGLLKRGFEQTSFNHDNFHFSDHELAFITLWSILNEISEAFYEKSQPLVSALDKLGTPVLQHPNGNDIAYLNLPYGVAHNKWVIRGQSDTFIEYSYKLKYDNGTGIVETSGSNDFMLDFEQQSPIVLKNNNFRIVPSTKAKTNYESTLFIQIAFLLEKKHNLMNCPKKPIFKTQLINLNEIRNHLYLTHGESVSNGFYDLTEKDKRKLPGYNVRPGDAIKDLFELIAFLLTGNVITITL